VLQDADVVVIGASLAGLLAAAGAAEAGRTVLVLERDELPDTPVPRPGVPQGRQPHILLHRGLLAMEQMLPGIRADLVAAGGIGVDTGALALLDARGWALADEPGCEVVSATRPLVEHVVRQRVSALSGVRLRTGTRVRGVRRSAGCWQVDLDGDAVTAPVVVDASGRSSRLPVWLQQLGVRPAPVSEIDAGLGYASRLYRGGPDPRELAGVAMVATPDFPRGGLALPVEGGGWLIGAVGIGDARPPRDAAGFTAFLGRMRDPALADLAASATPVGPVAVHRQTQNRRRNYHLTGRWPEGLVPLGDSFCAFNPVYGQGITVAAREALLLRDSLLSDRRGDWTDRLLREFAVETALPWAMATGADSAIIGAPPRRFDPVTGLQTAIGWWAAEVSRLAAHGDRRATRTLNRTIHLMGTPLDLLHPALVRGAIRSRIVGSGPLNRRPAGLVALERSA
jgi:flavin-dependent dehydrogenase